MENHSLQVPESAAKSLTNQLRSLKPTELLELRNSIDQTLGTEIKDFNLGEEMGLLFRQAQALLESVLKDDKTPPNQKSQVMNSVKAQIDRMVALREKIYTQERFKRFEMALVKLIKMSGTEVQQKEFINLYGEYLEDKGE